MSDPMPFESLVDADGSIAAVAAWHLDRLWRATLGDTRGDAGSGWFRVVSNEAHPLGNLAIVAGRGDVEATDEAIAPLRSLAVPSAVAFPDGDVDEALAEALARQGFEAHGAMPAMAVEIDGLGDTGLPDGYVLERIGAGDVGRQWADVLAAGYGIPRGLAGMMSPETLGADMAADASLQFFGIRHAHALVATSMLYIADGVAGIYCVSTLPGERGRGLGAHATAEPLRRARQLGYRVGVLQSSGDGHPVYLRLGFRDVATIPLFVHVPGTPSSR